MRNEPAVSVICITYNHGNYIQDAIEGFLHQKADFPYEIIIHDDASTDGTPIIIKKYEQQHSNSIRAIYQKENQYSKGTRTIDDIVMPLARGKYFALCEGDDYWIDPHKLQKQFDYMEQHPECSLCIHNAYIIQGVNKSIISGSVAPCKESGIIPTEKVIEGGGEFCATNSIFAPMRLAKDLPSFFDICSLDMIWQMYLSSCGETFCFSDYMSVHRHGVENSFNDRMRKNSGKLVDHIITYEKVRHAFDEYTNYIYHEVIKERNIRERFEILRITRKFKEMRTEPYIDYWKGLTIKRKVQYIIEQYIPVLFKLYISVKAKWSRVGIGKHPNER